MKPPTSRVWFPEETFGAAGPCRSLQGKDRKAIEADLIARGLLDPVKAKAPKLVTPSKKKGKPKHRDTNHLFLLKEQVQTALVHRPIAYESAAQATST
jgi:hypothetical protein